MKWWPLLNERKQKKIRQRFTVLIKAWLLDAFKQQFCCWALLNNLSHSLQKINNQANFPVPVKVALAGTTGPALAPYCSPSTGVLLPKKCLEINYCTCEGCAHNARVARASMPSKPAMLRNTRQQLAGRRCDYVRWTMNDGWPLAVGNTAHTVPRLLCSSQGWNDSLIYNQGESFRKMKRYRYSSTNLGVMRNWIKEEEDACTWKRFNLQITEFSRWVVN